MVLRLKKNLNLIKILKKCSKEEREHLINLLTKEGIDTLSEGALNILNLRIPVPEKQVHKLKPYKKHLYSITRKKAPINQRRQVLQDGGFLGTLLIALAGPLLNSIFKT